MDLDHNFRDLRPYQLYLQYKGPLGRWNVRAGHFLLPFGLLATYDTERLVLQGLEEVSQGIRKDTGVQAFGHLGSWDYALAFTEGVGDRRLLAIDRSKLLTGRVAHVRDSGQLGFSILLGRMLPGLEAEARGVTGQRRFGLDATHFLGPLTLRAEIVGGRSEGREVWGGILLGDYALTAKLELNTRAAYWRAATGRPFRGLGLTYRPWQRLYVRLAHNYGDRETQRNAFIAQVYFEFSKPF
jgi:hypothetical protein